MTPRVCTGAPAKGDDVPGPLISAIVRKVGGGTCTVALIENVEVREMSSVTVQFKRYVFAEAETMKSAGSVTELPPPMGVRSQAALVEFEGGFAPAVMTASRCTELP